MLRKVLFIIVICLSFMGAIYGSYFRWNHLWQKCTPIPAYNIDYHQDDTLRILFIGDSWAERRSSQQNRFLCSILQRRVTCPVTVVSKGKGGEKTREIYQLMFKKGGYGTKPFIESGIDFCIILAGINDAAANRGSEQFCYHFKLILDFLLKNEIIPVVIEIPDIDIWNVLKNKPLKDLLGDYIKSIMTQSKMYCFHEYRSALFSMLQREDFMDKTVYVPMTGWNGNGEKINPRLFTDDKIHLNCVGYHNLDKSIAKAIADHLHQSKNPALGNYFMRKDAH